MTPRKKGRWRVAKAAKNNMGQSWNIIDMHCHIDRMANAIEVAQGLAERNVGILDATVLPREYQNARCKFKSLPNIWVGCGLHPWWIASGLASHQDIRDAAALASKCPIVGEVGLDFSARFAGSEQRQLNALSSVLDACAEHPIEGRMLTIHATKSASYILKMLRDRKLIATSTCIFHWFSGTSDELAQARAEGCLFSINDRMLKTKRGREYARQIPVQQLLLETDAPMQLDSRDSADRIQKSLEHTLNALADLHGVPTAELGRIIAGTSAAALTP